MTLIEIIILGYVVNVALLLGYTVYGIVRIFSEGLDGLMSTNINNKTPKQNGGIWIPYAVILELIILFYQEFQFRKSNKSYFDFIMSRMKDE